MDDLDHDPLEETRQDQLGRDGKGRFRKGTSGNPRGRRFQLPHNPNLPASRRRIISRVADEEVEIKIDGKVQKITLFEANVRALGRGGIKDRVAAQRFIDMVTQNSEVDLSRSLLAHHIKEHVNNNDRELERLRAIAEPTSGTIVVPVADINKWPPEGMIDDEGRVDMAFVRGLQKKARDRENEE